MSMQRPSTTTIDVVGPADFHDLLPLVRGYCDFYHAAPGDTALMTLFGSLSGDPAHEGLQLLARGPGGEALGFATVYWTWSTVRASRIGVMNDLFVIPQARGTGVAEALIERCRDECRARRVAVLSWQTAPDNLRAQSLYERVGAVRETWIEYWLNTSEPARTSDPRVDLED
jgi:GNAT superfamily N-acetyltransferase